MVGPGWGDLLTGPAEIILVRLVIVICIVPDTHCGQRPQLGWSCLVIEQKALFLFFFIVARLHRLIFFAEVDRVSWQVEAGVIKGFSVENLFTIVLVLGGSFLLA